MEELIDPVPVGQEVRMLLGGELIARSAEVNVDHFEHGAGVCGQCYDPVSQIHAFVDVVGNEDDRDAYFGLNRLGGSDQTDTGRIAALLSGCGPREALPVLHRVAGVRRGGLPALRFQG